MLGRLTWSYFHLRRLKKASAPLGRPYQERLNGWLASSGFRRPVALKSSERVSGPMAAGLAQPAIVLPRGLAERLSEEELDQLVLHELAHLHRRDDWINLGQKILEALFFFHPAVRFIGRQLNMDREIACDDWAITQTGKLKPYAACLTKLVELTGRVETPALAPGGWTTRKQIVRRIEMSLNRRRNSSSRLSRTGIVVSLAVLVLVGLQAAQTSPLVVAAPQVSQDSALRVAALLPYESVNPTTLGTPWAQREETPEQSESHSEAESAQAEASPALRDQAEQLEREASRRSQEIERHMRQQQRAFAHQQREFERQVHQAERARAMALRGGYLAEGPPISEDELIELMLEIAQNDPDSEVRCHWPNRKREGDGGPDRTLRLLAGSEAPKGGDREYRRQSRAHG